MRFRLIFGDTKPAWWKPGDPTEYNMTTGKHYYDFDLIVGGLPSELVERIYECTNCCQYESDKKRFGPDYAAEAAEIGVKLPIGIDKDGALARGCKIVCATQWCGLRTEKE